MKMWQWHQQQLKQHKHTGKQGRIREKKWRIENEINESTHKQKVINNRKYRNGKGKKSKRDISTSSAENT